jgi:DNA-binding helix-hairpin-helix protein with protein kinase domain
MLRDVSRVQFVQAVKEGHLAQLRPGDANPLRARLDRLEKVLPALKKGDILDFTTCRASAPWCAARAGR